MNFNIYIFGTPNGYNQYPLDYNTSLFQEIKQQQRKDSQLTIYRKERVTYYTYIRNLSSNNSKKYFGLCLIFHGTSCRNIKKLFALFDKAYSEIILYSTILLIDKNGEISFSKDKFANNTFEIERIRIFFQNNLKEFNEDLTPFYSEVKECHESKALTISEENSTILEAIQKCGYVHILGDKSDKEIESSLNGISTYNFENRELAIKIDRIKKQNKAYQIILILLLLGIIGCFLALSSNKRNIQVKNNKIKHLETELHEKNDTILSQLSKISQLQNNNTKLNRDVFNLQETLIKSKN